MKPWSGLGAWREFARDLESGGADVFLRREKAGSRMEAGGEERRSVLRYL